MTVPVRVGMYFRGSGQWEKIAEFQLVEGRVAVVNRDEANDVVTALMTDGTWGRANAPVTAEAPEAFMAALMQPHESSYYQFRDES